MLWCSRIESTLLIHAATLCTSPVLTHPKELMTVELATGASQVAQW